MGDRAADARQTCDAALRLGPKIRYCEKGGAFAWVGVKRVAQTCIRPYRPLGSVVCCKVDRAPDMDRCLTRPVFESARPLRIVNRVALHAVSQHPVPFP